MVIKLIRPLYKKKFDCDKATFHKVSMKWLVAPTFTTERGGRGEGGKNS